MPRMICPGMVLKNGAGEELRVQSVNGNGMATLTDGKKRIDVSADVIERNMLRGLLTIKSTPRKASTK